MIEPLIDSRALSVWLDNTPLRTLYDWAYRGVGPPFIRRSSNAGSRRIKSIVVSTEAAKKIERYTQACE